MSLEYVARGEGIKASTVNSLIDAVAGRGDMSPDLLVTSTKSGPQLVVPTQLGSSSLKRDSVFDVENYTLSGWPMAKVKLGSKLENALEAVRVHTDDGIKNATSALLVFKNSSDCPFGGGTLSGYQLEDSHFGTEAAYGDTGWVKTKMEGVFGQTEPNIQVWKTKDNVIEVIGNVDSDETKEKLSALLSEGGMEASDLSTLKILEQFPLVSQTILQTGTLSKPTSRVTMKHGIVDVYSYGTEKNQRAMLKAFLVCYKVEDGQEGKKDSHWTWMIPMGPGAVYDSSNEGVRTSQFTYGGDQIVVECEEGNLSSGFTGDPMWVEESEFGNQLIAYGKFDSDGGAEINPGKVWIDLEYKYEKFGVFGTLNNGDADPPEGDAVLAPAIRIAEASKYKPKDDVVVGFEVHPSNIFSGTVGDLFRGEPKLDSYTPFDSQRRYNSLQWTKRDDGDGSQQNKLKCRCLELYGFDNAVSSEPTSADWYVARRYDSETSSATLVYVPLSSSEAIPDSSLSTSETSSLTWRTVVSSDPDDESKSVSSDVLQLWDFDLMSAYIKDLYSASMSGEYECHVLLRNATLSSLEYLALSALSATPDSHGMTGQKSIGILSTDIWNPTQLQLYAFDEDGEPGVSVQLGAVPQTLLSDTYEFVVRKGGKGGEVSYVKIAAAAGDLVDSSSNESQTSSLEVRTVSAEEEVSSVIQLWHFDHMTQRYWELSDALSGNKDVVLRDTETSAVAYMALSCLSSMPLCVDSEGSTEQKSVSFLEDENYQKQLQLYKMDQNGETLSDVQLAGRAVPVLPEDYEFVVRKNGAGGEISYAKFNIIGGGAGGASLPGPFEMDLDLSTDVATFTNCVMRIARGYFFYEDLTCQVPREDTIIYAVTEHSDSPAVSVCAGDYETVSQNLSSTWSNMLSTTVTPLYRTLSGVVKCDYRYMMNIQAYDSRNYTLGM